MRGFFGMPTRGGKLTIVNCLLWAIVALGAVDQQTLIQPKLMLPAFVACWPVAWMFFPGTLNGNPHGASVESLVVASVMIGVNSLLWGYGISWLLSLISWPLSLKKKRRDATRGFEVISPTPAESQISQTDVQGKS